LGSADGEGGSPDRLALVGDVHANLRALDAVLERVRAAGITRGAFTGDLVMRGPDPEGAVARARELGWPIVAGNTDVKVAGNTALAVEPESPRPEEHPASARVGSRSWTVRRLSKADRRFLARLPLVERVAVGDVAVAVVHASPENPSEVIDPATDPDRLAALAAELEAACVVTGHTHRPHAFESAGVLFVNPGAVGETRGEDRRPRWAWLEAVDGTLAVHLESVGLPLMQVRLTD
jgi:predicted phosphodiesterase